MSDVQKLSLAVLNAVSKFLAELPAEHLDDLANGTARLAFVPMGATEPLPAASRKRTAASRPSADMSDTIQRLSEITVRDQASAVIQSLTVANLKALASQLGMKGYSSMAKEDLKQTIIEFTVGNRINSAAIRAL